MYCFVKGVNVPVTLQENKASWMQSRKMTSSMTWRQKDSFCGSVRTKHAMQKMAKMGSSSPLSLPPTQNGGFVPLFIGQYTFCSDAA